MFKDKQKAFFTTDVFLIESVFSWILLPGAAG